MKEEEKQELDLFLEESFIPKYLKIRRRSSKHYKNKFLQYIQLSNIEHLNLDDESFDYVMKYLEQNEISVTGNSPALYSDYPNYYYTTNATAIPDSTYITIEEQKNYINSYQKTKNIEHRNKVVEANMSLVKNIANKYADFTGIDVNDLEIAGSIGLITAIEKVDADKSFINYFRSYIVRRILDEISRIQGLYNSKTTEYYTAFLKSKSNISKEYEFDEDYDEYEHIEEIAEDTLLNENQKRRIYMAYSLSLEENEEDNNLTIDMIESVINEIYIKEAKEALDKSISNLNNYQQQVIKEIFFNNKTLREIAEPRQVTTRAIENCKKTAIKKMRHQKDIYCFYNK